MYAGVAVMGYTMFGEFTKSQFTLNMPKNLVASKIAVWTTVCFNDHIDPISLICNKYIGIHRKEVFMGGVLMWRRVKGKIKDIEGAIKS